MADSTLGKSRSGCLFPRETAPRRGRRLRFWGLSGHLVEVCDPRLFASRGSRDLSGNFIVVRDCGTIRPGFSLSSRDCWPRGLSTCCCRSMNRDFCSRACSSAWRVAPGWRCRALPSYRTAHSKAGFSRLLDQLGLPQPATRIVKSASELRDAIRFPCVVKTSVGTASRGVWFVRNDSDLERRAAGVERQRRVRRRGAGAGIRRRHDREGASRVLPRQVDRLSCLSADCRGRRRRRGDQAKRKPAAGAHAAR